MEKPGNPDNKREGLSPCVTVPSFISGALRAYLCDKNSWLGRHTDEAQVVH